MRTAVVLTLLFMFIVNVPSAQMQENEGAGFDLAPHVVPDTQSIPMTSAINGRDYQLSVALPASYLTSDQSYPALYLLDPVASFLSVTEFVRWSAIWNELPEMIVVGIGYPTDDLQQVLVLREQDYRTSRDEFLDFIGEELIPLVDSNYRTDGADRALVGYSAGGEFVFHTLLTRPELFNRYLAIDSYYSEFTRLFSREDTEFRESLAGLNIKLFFAASGTEYLSSAVQNQAYEGLEAAGLSLGDVTHASALHLSLPAGIIAIYEE